jgi:hypothetical protein
MKAFNINITHGDILINLGIVPINDHFEIVFGGNLLGVIRKQGTDWILMKTDEIAAELAGSDPTGIVLGAAEVNLIAGEIENHLR